MEALNELCDLVAAHPDLLLADKLTWLSSRCAPPASPSSAPQRATRAHLHSLLALARLLPAGAGPPAAPLLAFLASRAFLSPAFWPQSFAPAPFLAKLLPLLAAAPASPALSSALSAALLAALDAADPASAPLARAFLSAAAAKPPQLLPADTAPVAQRLFLEFPGSDEAPPRAKGKGEDAAGQENGGIKEAVQKFEGEAIEALERKEVAFRLIVQMLGGEGGLEADKVAKVRNAAAWQVRSLTDFLKIRKRDWKEQGAQLRVRINTKLSCCQAAVVVLVRSVSVLDADSKASKDMLQQTLAWFIEATKSCILSSWRKLKICEELFCTLLNGISQITVSRGGQLLPVLLIPLKPLVVSTCSQADMTGCSPGALFEAVVKLSCEIIEFGWTKDRALVDTFIMRLAAYVRERNDYEEEV
uniref:PI4-kinase N-terminal domain-containing protein n=1 Tax=Aegilops tauschii subsp. strangulata TaxID=200361 RepID=A0A453H7D8_AEGTS